MENSTPIDLDKLAFYQLSNDSPLAPADWVEYFKSVLGRSYESMSTREERRENRSNIER